MVAMQTKARCLQIDEKLGGHLLYLDTCTEAAIFDLSNFILRDLKRFMMKFIAFLWRFFPSSDFAKTKNFHFLRDYHIMKDGILMSIWRGFSPITYIDMQGRP